MIGRVALSLLMLVMMARLAEAKPEVGEGPLARTLCAALASAVDTAGGKEGGPVFLVSYRPGPDQQALPPALRQSAFTYDNALAAIALTACGAREPARRIGDALLQALDQDRTFHDGRVRNAYRAGPLEAGPPALPGWWDTRQKLWAEDAYQDGTATGNVAWAALALLTLDQDSPDRRYRAGAERMLGWITANTRDQREPAGFSGGVDGFDPSQTKLQWKSTEHNLDVHALAAWLLRLNGSAESAEAARIARGFLDAAFAQGPGLFRLGTRPDGSLQPLEHLALDTQLWPLLGVATPPDAWRRAIAGAQERLAVPGGFDFNEDRDGLWVEGTAQAALTLKALGRTGDARSLLATLSGQVSPSGYLFAAREPRITTGIAIGPASPEPDFFYHRRPHLGATAWGALAALGWNPFTGRSVD
ncbi:hypothetical protein J2X36_003375 [Methylobacterium sp. BE186]|nr:hypothetical protein [Methylobacterium sp. BE186]MDR7038605.1 hypothetical protein [Methylobacterium sp. BE186]